MTAQEQRRLKRSPGRPAREQDPGARDRLMDAAADLIAERGAAATSFALIAQRAGLTPAMMHYYFRNRDHLLDAVVEERLAPLVASIWNPIDPDATAAEMLRGVVDRMLEGISRMPWVPSTWMREVLNEGGQLRSRVVRCIPFDKVRTVTEAIAREQHNHQANQDLDPVLMVFSTLGLVMMHMSTIRFFAGVFHREAPDKEAIRRHISALLLYGLQPAEAASSARGKLQVKPKRNIRTSTAGHRNRM